MGSGRIRVGLALLSVAMVVTAACGGGSATTQVVSNPSSSAQAHSVVLSWTASTTSTVTAYYVYRSTVSGPPYKLIASLPSSTTTYTDTGVTAGVTYYYVVTSLDQDQVQSDYSTEVEAAIPTS